MQQYYILTQDHIYVELVDHVCCLGCCSALLTKLCVSQYFTDHPPIRRFLQISRTPSFQLLTCVVDLSAMIYKKVSTDFKDIVTQFPAAVINLHSIFNNILKELQSRLQI